MDNDRLGITIDTLGHGGGSTTDNPSRVIENFGLFSYDTGNVIAVEMSTCSPRDLHRKPVAYRHAPFSNR